MTEFFQSFLADESGQGFTEYALVLALVAVGLILVLTALRDQLGTMFDAIITELKGASPSQYQPTS